VKTNFLKAAKVVWFSSTQGLQAEYFEQPKQESYLYCCPAMHWAVMKSSTLKHNRLLANSKRFSVTEILL
jgi:hypothetical protein